MGITTIKQDLDVILLEDHIGSKGRKSSLHFVVESNSKTRTLKTDYSFDIDEKNKKITFVKEKVSDKYFDVTYSFSLYTKSSLFAITNKLIRKTLEDIFNSENCKNILASHYTNDSGDVVLYYSSDVDFEKIDKKYVYSSVFKIESSTKSNTVDESEFKKVISIYQKQLFYGLVLSVVKSKSADFFHDIRERKSYVLSSMASIFGSSKKNLEIDIVLGIDFGIEKFQSLIQEPYPIESLKEAYKNGEIVFSGEFGEIARKIGSSSSVLSTFNIENVEAIDKILQETFSSYREVAIPSYKQLDNGFGFDNSFIPIREEHLRKNFEGGEKFYTSSVLSMLEAYHQSSSPTYFQNRSMLAFESISDIESLQNSIVLNIADPNRMILLKWKNDEEMNEMLNHIVVACEDESIIPYSMDSNSALLSIKNNGNIHTGLLLDSNVGSKKSDIISALKYSSKEQDIYKMFLRLDYDYSLNAKENIEKTLISMSDHFGSDTSEKQTKTFLNFMNNKMASNLKNAPRGDLLDKVFNHINNESMSFLSELSNIDKKNKIFPDIINIKNPNMSLEDISNSLFHINRWLMIPEYRQTILEQLKKNNYVIPDVLPYKFDLVNPENNKLEEIEKKTVVSLESRAGILNFQILPSIISVDSDAARLRFLEFAGKAIALSVREKDGEEKFQEKAKEIFKTMKELHFKELQKAKYIFTKITPSIQNGIIHKKEKFVALDESLSEVNIFDIPVFDFYSILKEENLINIEDRMKNASFRSSDVELMYNGISKFVNASLENNHLFFEKFDKIFLPMIDNVISNKDKFLFSVKNKMAVYSMIKKANNGDFFSQYFKTNSKNDFSARVEALFFNDEKSQGLKAELLEFYEKNIKGKEAYLNDSETLEKLKKIYFHKFDKNNNAVIDFLNLIKEKASLEMKMLDADISLITFRAFSRYIENASAGEDFSIEQKYALVDDLLYKVFNLQEHQAVEIKGFLALYLREGVNVELLFWEMRTKKTRTMIGALFMLSLVLEKPSLFFLQNKNYADIVQQKFDMLPLLVSETSVIIADKNDFKAEKAGLPTVLSERIFPNIISILKRGNLLKNPLETDTAAAVTLAESYANIFSEIRDRCYSNTDETFSRALENNKSDYPELDFFKSLYSGTENKELKVTILASYFYSVKLFSDGFLDVSDIQKISTNLERSLRSFVKNFNQSLESTSISEKHPARIVFAGKQLIDTFIANTDKDMVFKFDGGRVFTKLDIDMDHIPEEEENVELLSEYLKDEIALDEFSQKLASKESIAILFQNKLSKITDSHKKSIKFEVDKMLEKTLDSYSETISDDEKKRTFFSIYKIIKKSIVVPLFKAIENKDTHSDYFDFEKYQSKMITINERSPKVEGIKIDKLLINKTIDSLPSLLVDSGVIDDAIEAKELVLDIIEKEALFGKISEAVSVGSLKHLFDVIYLRKEAKTNSIKKDLSRLFPDALKQVVYSGTVNFYFKNGVDEILSVHKRSKSKDVVQFNSVPLRFSADVINPDDLADFRKTRAKVTEIHFSQNQGLPELSIVKAIDNFSGSEIPIKKQDTRKLSSSYIWEMEEREISAVCVDEAHKNVTGNKKKTTSALFQKIEEIFPDSCKIVSTGTPNKYGNFIELISGDIGNKTKRNIDKHCKPLKIDSIFIASMLEAVKSDSSIKEIISLEISAMMESAKGKSFLTDFMDAVAGIHSGELYSKLIEVPLLKKYFDDMKHITNSNEESNTIKDTLYTIMRKVLDSAKKTNNEEDFPFYEEFELAVLNPANKIVKFDAGNTYQMGIADIFNFINNANISFKRPSSGAKYDIIDKEKVVAFGQKSFTTRPNQVGEKEKLLQVQYLYHKKIHNHLKVSKILEAYSAAFSFTENILRENSIDALGLELSQFNEFCNRSQSSVEDGLKDYFMSYIKDGTAFELNDEREKVYTVILDSLNHLLSKESYTLTEQSRGGATKHIALPCGVLVDDFEREDSEALIKILKELNSDMISFDEAKFSDEETPSAYKQVSLKNNGINIKIEGQEILVRNSLSVDYEISPKLPTIPFLLNLAYADDASIVEALAYGKDAISLAVKHLNQGENIRQMTTRVSLTNAAIAFSILAASQREDKESNINIVISLSDEKVKNYIDEVKRTSEKFLIDNRIILIETNSTKFNEACAPALNKKEQIMVVGNYESLAEGIAMDFIQTGMYIGALDNIDASIQSFARQTGHLQNVSRFYLANNGQLASLDGKLSVNNPNFLHACKLSSDIDIKEGSLDKNKEAFQYLHGLKLRAPYTGYRNNTILKHFEAYEVLMTGDLSLLTENVPEDEIDKFIEKRMQSEIINNAKKDEEISDEVENSVRP